MISPPVNRNFEMFAMCTFGTNHVYFYGENSLDPLIKRWTDTNAYRLRYTSHQASTVIWVRLLERDHTGRSRGVTTNGLVQFPEGGYSHLRARLISRAGTEMVLASTGQSRYLTPSSTRKGHLEGWLLPTPLDDQRGSVIQIESPDGIPIGTLNLR
jgi:hypothetical protein